MNGVNPLYLVISKVDGYIEENNGNKYYFYRWYKKVLAKFKNFGMKLNIWLRQ